MTEKVPKSFDELEREARKDMGLQSDDEKIEIDEPAAKKKRPNLKTTKRKRPESEVPTIFGSGPSTEDEEIPADEGDKAVKADKGFFIDENGLQCPHPKKHDPTGASGLPFIRTKNLEKLQAMEEVDTIDLAFQTKSRLHDMPVAVTLSEARRRAGSPEFQGISKIGYYLRTTSLNYQMLHEAIQPDLQKLVTMADVDRYIIRKALDIGPDPHPLIAPYESAPARTSSLTPLLEVDGHYIAKDVCAYLWESIHRASDQQLRDKYMEKKREEKDIGHQSKSRPVQMQLFLEMVKADKDLGLLTHGIGPKIVKGVMKAYHCFSQFLEFDDELPYFDGSPAMKSIGPHQRLSSLDQSQAFQNHFSTRRHELAGEIKRIRNELEEPQSTTPPPGKKSGGKAKVKSTSGKKKTSSGADLGDTPKPSKNQGRLAIVGGILSLKKKRAISNTVDLADGGTTSTSADTEMAMDVEDDLDVGSSVSGSGHALADAEAMTKILQEELKQEKMRAEIAKLKERRVSNQLVISELERVGPASALIQRKQDAVVVIDSDDDDADPAARNKGFTILPRASVKQEFFDTGSPVEWNSADYEVIPTRIPVKMEPDGEDRDEANSDGSGKGEVAVGGGGGPGGAQQQVCGGGGPGGGEQEVGGDAQQQVTVGGGGGTEGAVQQVVLGGGGQEVAVDGGGGPGGAQQQVCGGGGPGGGEQEVGGDAQQQVAVGTEGAVQQVVLGGGEQEVGGDAQQQVAIAGGPGGARVRVRADPEEQEDVGRQGGLGESVEAGSVQPPAQVDVGVSGPVEPGRGPLPRDGVVHAAGIGLVGYDSEPDESPQGVVVITPQRE